MSNTFRPSAPVKHTVIEEGSEFKGSLTSSCPIDVRGRIEGEIATPALTVSKSGSVHGRAKVGAVRSEGELSGEFDAETIELAGSVRDNTVVRARSLEVKLTTERGKLQVIFGECELSVGDEPTEHDKVEAPVAAATTENVPTPAAEPAPAVVPAEATMVDLPAVAKPDGAEAMDADDEEEDGDAAQAAEGAPGANGGKKRRKKKSDVAAEEGTEMRWSHPPSQPPPAN
ncbi:MAG TPA: polymer-forming cytoskeletal protein [Polyangiaceae bacterium]